jgi:hypothetical protein
VALGADVVLVAGAGRVDRVSAQNRLDTETRLRTRNAADVPHVKRGQRERKTQWPITPHLTVFAALCTGCAERTRANPKSGSAAWRRRRWTVRSVPGEGPPTHPPTRRYRNARQAPARSPRTPSAARRRRYGFPDNSHQDRLNLAAARTRNRLLGREIHLADAEVGTVDQELRYLTPAATAAIDESDGPCHGSERSVVRPGAARRCLMLCARSRRLWHSTP